MHKNSAAVVGTGGAAVELASSLAMQARVRRGHARWLCLIHLDAARPEAISDAALLALVRSVYPDALMAELRRELDYLAMLGLVTVTDTGGVWHSKLTWQGVDIVEYTAPCPPGIHRPA